MVFQSQIAKLKLSDNFGAGSVFAGRHQLWIRSVTNKSIHTYVHLG